MPQPRGPRSFSAKLPRGCLSAPPKKQKRSASMRDYLRPDEVEAMMQAARKTGRHPVRDAAIILMMFRHGLRTAELVALRWHQSQISICYQFYAKIDTKTGEQTVNPLAYAFSGSNPLLPIAANPHK